MTDTLVFINRTSGCPLATLAHRVLTDYDVPFTELHYDTDAAVRERLIAWTGFLSVPTLYIAADADLNQPVTPPDFLEAGASPRGIDRGSMLTEPSADQLVSWLRKHGLIAPDTQPEG